MAGEVHLDPSRGDRKSSFRWTTIAWTIVGVLATFIGLIQGPKAFVDLHELMCGSSSWQSFAGRFGNCAAYAPTQPSRRSILANDYIAMLSPVEQRKIARDRIAASFSSRLEQDKLYAEGLRIGANEVCYLINYTRITPEDVPVLERFSTEPIVCSGKQAPLHIMTNGQGCWRDANFSSEGPIVLADRWNQMRPSSQLRDWAVLQLKAYRSAEASQPSDLATLCVKRHGPEAEKISDDERGRIDSIFAFTSSCKIERLRIFGDPVFSYTGVPYESAGGNVTDLCRSKTQNSGIDSQAVPIKDYLLRWAKG